INPRGAELLALDPAACLGTGWHSAIHAEDADWVRQTWESHSAKSADILVHFRVVQPDATVRYLASRLAPYAEDVHGDEWVGTLEDITDQHEQNMALARQALHDGLTGLANRALVADRLELALERFDTSSDGIGLL